MKVLKKVISTNAKIITYLLFFQTRLSNFLDIKSSMRKVLDDINEKLRKGTSLELDLNFFEFIR